MLVSSFNYFFFQCCQDCFKSTKWCTAITEFNSLDFIMLTPEVMKGLVDLSSKWFLNWKNIGLQL